MPQSKRLTLVTLATLKSHLTSLNLTDKPVSFCKLTHDTHSFAQQLKPQISKTNSSSSNSASTMISTNYNMYQIIYLSILLLCYNNRIVVESFSSPRIAITTNSRQHYTSSLSRCNKSRSGLSMSAGEATLPMPIEGEGTYRIALYDVYYLAAMYGFR